MSICKFCRKSSDLGKCTQYNHDACLVIAQQRSDDEKCAMCGNNWSGGNLSCCDQCVLICPNPQGFPY